MWSIDWGKNAYEENRWERGEEPRRRRLHVVASYFDSQWHITITFGGSLHPDRIARANYKKRRQDLEDLCLCLDFNSLPLSDNIVTELRITRMYDDTPPYHEKDIGDPSCTLPLKTAPHIESEYSPVVAHLQLCIREDPFHVRFPSFDTVTDIFTEDLSAVTKCRMLSGGVYEVFLKDRVKQPYVFKAVDRPLYVVEDSQVLDQELKNLQLLRGTQNILQLVAAVVSPNPYQTNREGDICGLDKSIKVSPSLRKTGLVLRGILLEYHPNGTLEDALETSQGGSPSKARPWLEWAFQIANALAHLHAHRITHMDLKPFNIVISAENEAILIDISGIGGVTREWLAPEMLNEIDPLSTSIDARVWNDIWALGKIFLKMANVLCVGNEQLRNIALSATVEDPSLRRSIPSITSALFDLGT